MTALKFWGWGREGEGLTTAEADQLAATYAERFGIPSSSPVPVPQASEISLRAPRLAPSGAVAAFTTSDHFERLLHSYGKSFFDSARAFARDFANPPDAVAIPRDEAEVVAALDWCDQHRAIAIPFGAGSSVVGGIEPPAGERPVVSIDLRNLGRVLEIDAQSETARIQGGIYGPALEQQLRSSGLTLRHFPQSFEYSTLGGWIATRSGGHFVTLYTHIDDLVQSLRVVTPRGTLESRRLPGSGAGPSPDRLFIGSEGTLGIITEAWMRLRRRPSQRTSTTVKFADFYRAAAAVRAISQANLYPTNCRLVDATEALINGAGDGRHALLVLGFESADHAMDASMRRAVELCADFGGVVDASALADSASNRSGAAGQWRDSFIKMPYNREVLTPREIIVETFETAITWERFEAFHTKIMDATRRAIREVTGRDGVVTCRFTHVYPDGPAPYFSFHCAGKRADMIKQCWDIKTAASEVLLHEGGTITHHHAVGRDHRRWYDRQRPELFAQAYLAAKKHLDPNGMLNPGVLFDPR